MTREFIQAEISMLFCSEKFSGWWVVVGDIVIIASSSRSRSLKRFEIDLGPGPKLDNIGFFTNKTNQKSVISFIV